MARLIQFAIAQLSLAVNAWGAFCAPPLGRKRHPPSAPARALGAAGRGGDSDGDSNGDGDGPSIDEGAYGPFGETALVAALGGTTLLLGAIVLNLATNPNAEIDVDLYLSISRSLGGLGGGAADGVPGSGVGGVGGEIVQLPALSPAEQIVGAFFGPPQPK